jgi:hypothetical protein
MRIKREEAPAWVFSWRPLGEPVVPKMIAFGLVFAVFAILLTSVRIRVVPPTPWAARKAAVIQVTGDANGRALRIRAREGGPFPSRFEVADWDGAAALEHSVMMAAIGGSAPTMPELRELSGDDAPRTPPLSSRGELVFPRRTPKVLGPTTTNEPLLVPVLHALSGIRAAELPETLPPFQGAMDKAVKEVSAEPGQFLVWVDGTGQVQDCVSLSGQDDAGLARWMRGVRFRPEKSRPSRWVVVGVSLKNQSPDGPDAR